MYYRAFAFNTVVAGLLLGSVHCSRAPESAKSETEVAPAARTDLTGTSWRLVKLPTDTSQVQP